ncbi:hypothetical protein LTR12_014330 [Friedmanniomyces endolithicus]|nr:hypothetical protein LTR74_002572 [Friedmanniomyces endolithicus]KAK1811298.1 hypothetical protein LTR12_014330 [Friedmanniomyces endolithicus]
MERYHERPPTPQAMLHRLPDRPDIPLPQAAKPSKVIILISASNEVAGKVQIANLHETAAKAARVGTSAPIGRSGGDDDGPSPSGANEPRYQRMWMSKMTRTGLLFPEESRPANSGFSGFGGSSPATDKPCINKPPTATYLEEARLRKANPVLMVVTHPDLHSWHRTCIRMAVGEYGIGVIFIPLDHHAEPPVLRMLDPQTMTSFTSLSDFAAARKAAQRDWSEEIVLSVDIEATVSDISEEIISGVQEIMNA